MAYVGVRVSSTILKLGNIYGIRFLRLFESSARMSTGARNRVDDVVLRSRNKSATRVVWRSSGTGCWSTHDACLDEGPRRWRHVCDVCAPLTRGSRGDNGRLWCFVRRHPPCARALLPPPPCRRVSSMWTTDGGQWDGGGAAAVGRSACLSTVSGCVPPPRSAR